MRQHRAASRRENRVELCACAFRGHITYAPEDTALADRLTGSTGVGQVWRCLRCGEFTPGVPQGHGPVRDAPMVLRGNALRQSIIVRVFGLERFIRAILLGLAAWVVWEFRGAQGSIEAVLNREIPLLQASGLQVSQMTGVHELEKALAAKPSTLTLVTLLLATYGVLEVIEGVGLWLLARWGEYFAVVVTSFFMPLEIHELAKGITPTRALIFAINVAVVVFLLISKRLFGLRGGRSAYDRERRGEQLIDIERAAMKL
ncbi:MAG: DUF2127 domain-containing protein [Mycobacteriaceae bacterium]|nr:DUF2127 domain-containing protein [Mycobacteriaceae bacterium]